jgi:catechol-2,3-dioxygenase
MNTWESLGGPQRKNSWPGLDHFTVTIPEANLKELSSRLSGSHFLHGQGHGQLFISDPDEIELVFRAAV